MTTFDTLRYTRFHLTNGSGEMPAVGFGTLIPDPVVTKQATKAALGVGFRHFDCAERYRNEAAVGEAFAEAFEAGTLQRKELFVTTKLWNADQGFDAALKAFDHSVQRRVLCGLELVVTNRLQAPVREVIKRQMNLRTADVACENHSNSRNCIRL